MKMYLKNTSLTFGSSHFWEQMGKEGCNNVEVCFEWDKEVNKMPACLYVDTSKEKALDKGVQIPE